MQPLSENFYSLTLADLIGFLVTIVSVILIVKQLRDSKLAAQMEGFLMISDRFAKITKPIQFVDGLMLSEEWLGLDNEQAYQYLMEDEERRENYYQIGAFYEVTSALLRRGALDKKLAIDTFGGPGAERYRILEKAIHHHREIYKAYEMYDQWEWLAYTM